MRNCPECGAGSLKRITHLYKEYRCGNCNSEFETTVPFSIIGALLTEVSIIAGIIVGLANSSWMAFISISVIVPFVSNTFLRKKSKLKLVGLRAKLKEKGL